MTASLEQYRIKREQFKAERSKRINGEAGHAVIKALIGGRITIQELSRRSLTVDSLEHDLNPQNTASISIGDTYITSVPKGECQEK